MRRLAAPRECNGWKSPFVDTFRGRSIQWGRHGKGGLGVNNLLSVWQWLQPYRRQFALALVLVFIQAAIAVALPFLFGVGVIDNVLLNLQDAALLGLVALGAVLLMLFKGMVTYGEAYTMNYIGNRFVVDLRNRVYDHVLNLPLGFFSRRQSGEIVSRMTNDISAIQHAVAVSVAEMMHYVLVLIGIVGALLFLHWRLALVALLLLPLATWTISRFGVRIRSFGQGMHEKVGDMAALLNETVGALRVVKAFTMEGFARRRFREANQHNFDMTMKSVQAQATLRPVVELILVTGMVAVLWFGGREVIAGTLSVGQLMSFLAYLGMLSQPVGGLTRQFGLIQQAAAAGDRLRQLLETDPEPYAQESLPTLPPVSGAVQLRKVSFGYDEGEPVLRDVDLALAAGETVALVGPSGAGKSTLLNLIPRFYDPDEGAVLLDEHDLRGVDARTVRRQIGLVPQDPVLFDISVAENIAAGKPDATREQIEAAAKLAFADEFIRGLPDGYDTKVGERGANLSGGQRQRIAIARAVLADPRILLLDEATSALDTESEAAIHAALQRIKRGRTVVLIAHRASTVRLADRIVVMDEGRIVQDGTHDELVRRPGLYKRLYAELLEAAPPDGGSTAADGPAADRDESAPSPSETVPAAAGAAD